MQVIARNIARNAMTLRKLVHTQRHIFNFISQITTHNTLSRPSLSHCLVVNYIKFSYALCVRIPLRAFRRFRRICRGPGWDSTVPWFDRQLQVELQGFGFGKMTISVRPFLSFASARWRMMLGSPAAVKDQPASPQPSPRPDGGGKSFLTTYENGRQVYKRRTRDDTSST